MPAEGDKISLSAQLSDKETNKFIRVSVFNASGAAISGSPVTLTHRVTGFYTDFALDMPGSPVHAISEVFEDALFATPSPKYTVPGIENIDLSPEFSSDAIDDAIAVLLSAARQADIELTVNDEVGVKVDVQDEDGIDADISDSSEIGMTIQDADALGAKISDPDGLNIDVEDC